MRRAVLPLLAALCTVLVLPVVASQDAGEGSDYLVQGASYSRTFDAAGEYAYYCHPHPQMTGRVVVADREDALSGNVSVVMRDIAFSPAEITVAPGTTVTWTNEDVPEHTVTFGDVEGHMHATPAPGAIALLVALGVGAALLRPRA